MAAKPGQVALRRFDHAEAIRRHAAGETKAALAREYGVSRTAVLRVVNPEVRERMRASATKWTRDNYRTPCLGGCGTLVWKTGTKPRTGYCIPCAAERRIVEQHGTEVGYRNQGCRCESCRAAAAKAKRKRRERAKVPCSHGCGTLVDSYNARYHGKPPECGPCSRKRIHAEQKRRAGR